MGKLSDILRDGQQEKLSQRWDETEAAEDFGLLPAGEGPRALNAGTDDPEVRDAEIVEEESDDLDTEAGRGG